METILYQACNECQINHKYCPLKYTLNSRRIIKRIQNAIEILPLHNQVENLSVFSVFMGDFVLRFFFFQISRCF